VASDPRRLVEVLAAGPVSRIVLVPSLLSALLDGCPDLGSLLPELKLWISSGEELPIGLARRFRDAVPDATLLNLYGSSEVSADVTWYDTSLARDGDPSVPIGRPIANTRIYLLDPNRQPVPVGVPGEIYVGGDGLARGYLDRPRLTAERFVPDPFGADPAARLYRTGDRGRYRSDGNLEFLGRTDHQVKIRGCRLELGEVEAALEQHPTVRQAVAVVRESTPGEPRVVAYVVPHAGSSVGAPDVRAFLRTRLPEFAIPSGIVALDALPLMPNGKIDLARLPLPDRGPEGSPAPASRPPRDSVEYRLARAWEKVLGVAPVGVTEDFFDLGGHSLLAVRLFAEIEDVFGRRLPLATLFQAPTVERMARVLREEGCTAPWTSLVPLQARGSGRPFFCIHGVGGHVFIYRDLARHLGPDFPLFGLEAVGVHGQSPHTRIEDMAAHYLREILTVQSEGPYHLGGACYGGFIAFEMARQLRAAGREVGLLALFDAVARVPATQKIPGNIAHLRRLGVPGQLRFIARKLVGLGREELAATLGALERLRAPLPHRLRAIEGINLRAIRDYTFVPYDGRLTLFRAMETTPGYEERDLGWTRFAAGGVDLHEVPGNHETLLREPHVRVLAHALTRCLADARAARAGQSR
jgi:thioesterase domain-containing protein